MPQEAEARPYTVVACDSAGLFGYSSAAWEPFANAGNAYKGCPTGGGSTAGVSNRLIGTTYAAFSHSGHAFTAPPGATITHVRWAGRMARDNCHWATFVRASPSGALVLGLPNGGYCDATGFDNRGWPMTFAAPEGTTRLEQLVICGANQCLPGATMHAHVLEVTVDDPIPPSISLDGPLARGEWVSGRIAAGRSRSQRVTTPGSSESLRRWGLRGNRSPIRATSRNRDLARTRQANWWSQSATSPMAAIR